MQLYLDELFSLSSQVIMDHFFESYRHIQYPALADKKSSKNFMSNQEKEIQEQAELLWDTMFPSTKKEEDEYPKDYPNEFRQKRMEMKKNGR